MFTTCILILAIPLPMTNTLTITPIPSTKTPPEARIGASAVYDPTTESIITIGGQIVTNGLITSDIYQFNLKTLTWETIDVNSEYKPEYLVYHSSFLRPDRKILSIGMWSEVFLFDLKDYSWTRTYLSGDSMSDIRSYGSTSFVMDGIEYIAIFGGIASKVYVDDLYLINTFNFSCKRMPKNGSVPKARSGPSLNFFNGSLYMFGYSFSSIQLGIEKGNELFRYNLNKLKWEIINTTGDPPSARILHYSCVYQEELYIFYGAFQEYSELFNSTYKYNFQKNIWTFVTSYKLIDHVAASLLIGSKFYLIYGRNLQRFLNSIICFDLNDSIPSPEYISQDWLSPGARLQHVSFTVNLNLYIFGGSSSLDPSNSNYYNDLWSFSFDKQSWSLVKVSGDIPSPRKNFGHLIINGDLFIIFGGEGPDGYLNDFYYFKESSKKWHKIITIGEVPSGRAESCLAYYNKTIYVIGGRNDDGLSEIWVFDTLTYRFTLSNVKLEDSDTYVKSLIGSTCWIEGDSTSLHLFITGGVDFSGYPNLQLIEIKLFRNTHEINVDNLGSLKNNELVGSDGPLVKYGKYGIRFGGSVFTWMILYNLVIIDFEAKTIKNFQMDQSFPFFGHSAVHFNRSIYVFGGGGATEIYKSYTDVRNQFLKIDFDSNDEFQLNCSKGTFGPRCQPCAKGTYFLNKSCEKCPIGTFNDLYASTSFEQCLPCPSGYFSKKEGSLMCLKCESSAFCPLGTITPQRAIRITSNETYQPSQYKNKKDKISEMVKYLWCLFAVTFGLFFAITRVTVFWDFLEKIDFFSSRHRNEIGVPVVYKRTNIGGAFSVFFILLSIVSISGGFLVFLLDNVTEIQALIPILSVDTPVKAELMILKISFSSYGGVCVIKNECSSDIKQFEKGFEYSFKKIECSWKNEQCLIIISFHDFSLKSKSSEILIAMEEKNSHSNRISVNISSSSSIPNQISGFFTSIRTSNDDLVFKGSDPSKFYYKFTPSVIIMQIFKSESSEWPSEETGYHILINQDPEKGSEADQQTLYLTHYQKVLIFIQESETAMVTNRLINQSFNIFLGNLLGSIFGLMGTVAAVMRLTEIFTEKLGRNRRLKNYIKQRVLKKIILDKNEKNKESDIFSETVVPELGYKETNQN